MWICEAEEFLPGQDVEAAELPMGHARSGRNQKELSPDCAISVSMASRSPLSWKNDENVQERIVYKLSRKRQK